MHGEANIAASVEFDLPCASDSVEYGSGEEFGELHADVDDWNASEVDWRY